MSSLETFDPVRLSIEENQFLLAHLGKPTVVALRDVPANVNPKAVRPILERVNELEELRAHAGEHWAGVSALQQAIKIYLEQAAKWERDHQRYKGAPRFPSMYSFDHRGRPHRGGPGSDGDTVSTYLDDATGERHLLSVPLHPNGLADWKPAWLRGGPDAQVALPEAVKAGTFVKDDGEKRRIECLVCGHTESYNPDSASSRRVALARIGKHMVKTKTEELRHKEAHSIEFGN